MLNIISQQNKAPEQPAQPAAHGDYRKYVDAAGDFDSKQLKYSYWLAAHRVLLYRLGVSFLIALSAVLWIYSLSQWGVFVFFGLEQDRALDRRLTTFPSYAAVNLKLSARPLQVVSNDLLAGSASRVDAVAEIQNTNKDFLATFSYYFSIGTQTTTLSNGFILPNETRYIASPGAATGGSGATLVLRNVAWKRISAHRTPAPLAFQAARSDFKVSNFSFKPRQEDGPAAHLITFTLENPMLHGFKRPTFYALLYQQGVLVGLIPFSLESLPSLEKAVVELRSFAPITLVDEVRVQPNINVYDAENYLPPS